MTATANEINEQSTAVVTVSFLDEDGDPAIPTSGTYKITDFVMLLLFNKDTPLISSLLFC